MWTRKNTYKESISTFHELVIKGWFYQQCIRRHVVTYTVESKYSLFQEIKYIEWGVVGHVSSFSHPEM